MFTFLLILLFVAVVNGVDIKIYADAYFQGEYSNTRCNYKCEGWGRYWDRKISSIDTKGGCIRVFDDSSCNGDSTYIYPGTPSHDNLEEIGWNDRIMACTSCN
ncbi:uncharacterized protein LOC110860159 [Folsomia candida]|uniref:Beta-crystallin S n=1 Tax=Folsomia candida TaxID=158441 RepID=A0A226D8V3_FOLCA|nr:uncharacterized protein LOC110860159 [Folsomia candida]OXA41629.1 Beta-crystallin S [Folsomia candida]